ncbi:MAG: divergent polysaccharide deacetylase family protein [Acidobacteriota bacterium]
MLLVAAGFYIGFRAAQPPPPPDFSALREGAPDSAPGTGSSRGAGEGPASIAGGDEGAGRSTAADPGPDAASAPEPVAPGSSSESVVVTRQPPPRPSARPRVALVIDDLGRSLQDVETLGSLGIPVTYAVLPFEAKTREVVARLRERGEEILCHLPMEAAGRANPGPGALRLSMSDGELRRATLEALGEVPGAIGVNNHMGSAVVADSRAMAAVLGLLKDQGLAFLDSRTTAETLGYSMARHMGVRAAERQVFLDTHRDRAFIAGQFQALLDAAEKRGGAIGIAHPYDETLEILVAEVPKARAAGFEFIPASSLFDP